MSILQSLTAVDDGPSHCIFLGYLWVWMGPQEGGSSLGGTRYQSDSLKQMKTKLHNLIAEVLKRPDVDLNSPAMVFSNNMYIAKRNRTAAEPMEGNAGDRKRKALEVADREKMDAWMLEDLSKVLFSVGFLLRFFWQLFILGGAQASSTEGERNPAGKHCGSRKRLHSTDTAQICQC